MAVTSKFTMRSIGGEFVANGWTNGDQFGSEVVGLSNRGYAVVYGTESFDPTGNYPIVSFYKPGFSQSEPFEIPYITSPVDMIGDPEIIELANGNVAVIWKQGEDASNSVVGTIFDPNTGEKLTTEFTISYRVKDFDPEATALSAGNWVVAMSQNGTIRFIVMNQNGNKAENTIKTALTNSFDPAITALDDGGWVITYTKENAGSPDSVWGQIFNADGSVRAADFLIGQSDESTQSAVAKLNNGNWAVTYVDTSWTGITVKIFDLDGVDLAGAIKVDISGSQEADPDITVLENGFFVVSWTDPIAGGFIMGRVFNQHGTAIALEGNREPFIIAYSSVSESDVSISTIFNGRFIATWTDEQTDGSLGSIAGEIIEISSEITSDEEGDLLQGNALSNVMFGNGG